METNRKNGEKNNIDEDYLMSIMAGSTKKESANAKQVTSDETHLSKPKTKAKKTNDIKYVEQFLTHQTMNKRGDKSIYIRPEYHERLSRIIQIVADDQIPLYAYLDNILAHHFEMFEQEITEDFNNKYRPIF
ncbi:DUF3408 domain-containing protein [Epilithonimonas arachidiradicis]|nr:DUF3408 domain-containing protein [Epilithonimonas arachidiradicis]RKE86690.1 uncharacterized protein DUF3408 [Epilithonimonas arachidiradicis]